MRTRGATRESSDLGREEDGERREEKKNQETWQKNKPNSLLVQKLTDSSGITNHFVSYLG